MILSYLLFGLGMYVGAWCNSEKSFSSYSNIALIKGFLGISVWPVFLILKILKKTGNEVHL